MRRRDVVAAFGLAALARPGLSQPSAGSPRQEAATPLIGFVHGSFVLLAGMSLLPGLHPRMASEQHGPTPTRQLEPPGFLALNYGRRTPVSVLLAHLVYGSILGAFYRVRRQPGG